MKVTRTSILTGKARTLEIAVTEDQLEQLRRGKHVQWLLPHLSADEREFLISGITQDEWDSAIPDE